MPRLWLVILLTSWVWAADLPNQLVIEGIPTIEAGLKKELQPYLNLGGASFRGWHPTERAAIVTTRVGDFTQLHVMDTPLGKRKPVTHGNQPIKTGWSQPHGTKLLYQEDADGNENFQLRVADFNNPKAEALLLTDGKSRNTDPVWSKDGKQIAYASNRRNGKDSDIIVTNLTTPIVDKVVQRNNSPGWSPLDWFADGQSLLLRESQGQESTKIWKLNLTTGERKLLTSSPACKGIFFTQILLAEKEQAVYALANFNSDFLNIVRLDLQTGELTALEDQPTWDGEELALSEDEKVLGATFNREGFSELHAWALPQGKKIRLPATPSGVVSSLSFRPQSHEVGFSLNCEDSPSDAWSVDVDQGLVTRWTNRLTKTTLPLAPTAPEIIRVKSFDDLSVPALVYYPDAKKFPGKRPVLMIFHGGPESQSRPGFRGSYHYFLQELGIALVYPNIRGSLGYGRRYLNLDNGLLRQNAIRDVAAILDWVGQSDRLDAQRIASAGGSYGGFMSLACLTNYPERFCCGIDSVGITNFVTFLHDTSDYRRGARRMEYGDERKPELREFLESISPANHAAQIRVPLFIIQGKNDPRVPFTEAERMRDAVRQQGGTVWYLLAQDEGHGFTKKANVDFQFAATVLFLKTYLLPPPSHNGSAGR
jgi:dipeptidyl aminopeptidase/acylaminoacyl peptidase